VYRSKTLRRGGQAQAAPTPLDEALLCQRYGVTAAQLQHWRAQPVVTLEVAADAGIIQS
jgi:hypothetical protein